MIITMTSRCIMTYWKHLCIFALWSWNHLKLCMCVLPNHPLLLTMLAASGRTAKDADQRGKVERHIEGAFGSRHTTTNHGSQLRSRCWFYGGRKTGEPGEKPSKRGRDQLQLYSHEFQVFWQSTRGYTQVVTHPAITSVRPGLIWNSVWWKTTRKHPWHHSPLRTKTYKREASTRIFNYYLFVCDTLKADTVHWNDLVANLNPSV